MGTFEARSPSRSRRICADLDIQSNSVTAMKRSPPASGAVIALISRSATSRTSTKLKPSLGTPGIPFSSRSIAWTE